MNVVCAAMLLPVVEIRRGEREGAYVFQAVRILVSLSTTTAFERFPGIHVHFLDLGASPHLGGFGGWRIYVFRE
jgi:hypothetical protein